MKNNRDLRAFSLIEISIVVLIIGILVAGVTQSTRLLSQAKISSAKTLTQSSPVSSVKNLALWIESTSDASFDPSETDDVTSITNWYDLNPQSSLKNSFNATSNKPLYSLNIINGLPAIKFSGSNSVMNSANFSNIATGSITVFAVVKLPATVAAEKIISKSDGTNTNFQFGTGTASTGWQFCDNGTCANATQYNGGNSVSANGTYVASVVYTGTSAASTTSASAGGITFFQNGANQNSPATTANSPSTTAQGTLALGGGFNGFIGELIVFDRALKKEERHSIEAYLGKKWGVNIAFANI
jgi:hypothetical protein